MKQDNTGPSGYCLRLHHLGKTEALWRPLNGARTGPAKQGWGAVLTDTSTENELTLSSLRVMLHKQTYGSTAYAPFGNPHEVKRSVNFNLEMCDLSCDFHVSLLQHSSPSLHSTWIRGASKCLIFPPSSLSDMTLKMKKSTI